MRRVIQFEDGQKAVVYKRTGIRNNLTHKQALDFMFATQVLTVKSKKEILIIGGYHE